MTHTTHCTTTSEARQAAREGRRWRLRLEYFGYNPDNASGHSEKFWQLEGEGRAVTRRWGRFGSKGQTKADTLAEGLEKAAAKLAKGYRPVAGR
jgi:predicted DNA-binding WGR domain protein